MCVCRGGDVIMRMGTQQQDKGTKLLFGQCSHWQCKLCAQFSGLALYVQYRSFFLTKHGQARSSIPQNSCYMYFLQSFPTVCLISFYFYHSDFSSLKVDCPCRPGVQHPSIY